MKRALLAAAGLSALALAAMDTGALAQAGSPPATPAPDKAAPSATQAPAPTPVSPAPSSAAKSPDAVGPASADNDDDDDLGPPNARDAAPPPSPPGMRAHRRPGPPSPRIRITRSNGDFIVDVTCGQQDTARECASITVRLIERLGGGAEDNAVRSEGRQWRDDRRDSDRETEGDRRPSRHDDDF